MVVVACIFLRVNPPTEARWPITALVIAMPILTWILAGRRSRRLALGIIAERDAAPCYTPPHRPDGKLLCLTAVFVGATAVLAIVVTL